VLFNFPKITEQEEEHTQVQQYLCAIDAQWREVEDTMKSKVWPDLDEMYPKDLEVWFVELFLQTLITSIG